MQATDRIPPTKLTDERCLRPPIACSVCSLSFYAPMHARPHPVLLLRALLQSYLFCIRAPRGFITVRRFPTLNLDIGLSCVVVKHLGVLLKHILLGRVLPTLCHL